MEDKFKLESLFAHARDYVEERIKLVNLNIHDKASRSVSGIAAALIFLIFGLFVLLFLSLALSWWIGQMLEPYLGFLIVGGAYLIIATLFYVNREKWIKLPVMNIFLKNIADDED